MSVRIGRNWSEAFRDMCATKSLAENRDLSLPGGVGKVEMFSDGNFGSVSGNADRYVISTLPC